MTFVFFALLGLLTGVFAAAVHAREKQAVRALVEAKLEAHLKSQVINSYKAQTSPHSKGD